MDTVFHSADACGSMTNNSVLKYPQFFVQKELNIVLYVKCMGLTGNCSLTLSIFHMHVNF